MVGFGRRHLGRRLFVALLARASTTWTERRNSAEADRRAEWTLRLGAFVGFLSATHGEARTPVLADQSQTRAAVTRVWVPVSRVGWMTGANAGEWLTGMSWAIRPACSASRYRSGSVPPSIQ